MKPQSNSRSNLTVWKLSLLDRILDTIKLKIIYINDSYWKVLYVYQGYLLLI